MISLNIEEKKTTKKKKNKRVRNLPEKKCCAQICWRLVAWHEHGLQYFGRPGQDLFHPAWWNGKASLIPVLKKRHKLSTPHNTLCSRLVHGNFSKKSDFQRGEKNTPKTEHQEHVLMSTLMTQTRMKKPITLDSH